MHMHVRLAVGCVQATNMLAALVMSGEQSRIPKTLQQFSVAAKDSFEVALNMACAAVLAGELPEAHRLLQLAETKGLEVLTEEDVSQVVSFLRCPENVLCVVACMVSSQRPLTQSCEGNTDAL